MEFQKRTNDIEKVFDQRWKANHNYDEIQKKMEQRQQHFNKMYHIRDKNERKKEILEANSVNGQIKRLEENMRAASGNELFRNRNSFR